MKKIAVKTVGELREAIESLDRPILFRGQTSHYEKNGNPSVVTSFDRKGCIPSQMLKWSRYAESALEAYIGPEARSLDFMQALLQHYGWRSFYVDCSSDAAVSAWFASHVYSDKRSIELCEDCGERPVMLVKRMATYDFSEGDGHLYALDLAKCAQRVGAIDLAVLAIESARQRTQAQDAWLLGPLRNSEVPSECFLAHITGPRSVFREFAAGAAVNSTDALFPSIKEDPILAALLRLPWKRIEKEDDDEFDIPFFRRALDLPEYQDSFVKIVSGTTAFFQQARVSDFGSIDGEKYGGIAIPMPEIVLFGTADPAPLRFPKIGELLSDHRSVAFEVDELIQHITMQGTAIYQKGVVVIAHEPDLIEVCELQVKHPGLEMTGAGINKGWFYRVANDGTWQREVHAEQCGCGNDVVHLRHVSSLHIIEHYLAATSNFR